ncbi:mammalian cell entry protein [Mycolicibacterium stellerae]|uniref:mammalian cell entry protein n=1 Tax=Mycolicibacterium stellerae TaxID=2358193 RepID=UPI0013DE1401|nr:mammalian cell entry protein [Mycolicibacterium stellerae]
MARHADTAELTDSPASADGPEAGDSVEVGDLPRQHTPARRVVAAAMAAAVVLAALGGWLGYRDYRAHQRQTEEQRFVTVGRQAALNLTTIDYTRADSDVARILDSATGTFQDDFQKRAKPFVDVVKQAKSKSEGAVTEAGLESLQGDHGQVLVSVQVKTSTNDAPPGDARTWRMRIDVQRVGADLKVANIQFVQ